MTDFYREAAMPPAGSTLSGPPGSNVPQYEGWDPAGDGGPDCEFCGVEMRSSTCKNEECPGELLQCEVTVFHGSPNPDSAAFGPDEACENYAVPGTTVCEDHAYVLDEPSFETYR
jgi:hypothetical protein